MNKGNTLDLTTGSVTKKLLAFAIPYILGMVLQQLYSFIGAVVVSNFSADGPRALAAVGSTGSITSMLIGFFTGLSLGANVLCSNHIGAKQTRQLRRTMHCSLPVALICGILVLVIGVVACEPILKAMNVPGSVMALSARYLRIYFICAPFLLLYNTGAAIMRAHGDTKRPMTILMVSGGCNVVFNFIFVVFLNMSADGVALSAVASQVISAFCVLRILFSEKDMYGMSVRELEADPKIVLSILRLGVPSGFNTIIFYIAGVILQSTLNTFGETAMAGQSAANNITLFLHTIPNGLYAACTSFAGQCYGARDYKRIDRMSVSSLCWGMSVSVVLAGIVTVFRFPLMRIFDNDSKIIAAGIPYLLIMSWGYVLYVIPSTFMGCLQGMRKSTVNAVVNLVCICLSRGIWAWFVFPMRPTITMLNLCYPVSFAMSGAALFALYLHTKKKEGVTAR